MIESLIDQEKNIGCLSRAYRYIEKKSVEADHSIISPSERALLSNSEFDKIFNDA
jgi:hypothetical protein